MLRQRLFDSGGNTINISSNKDKKTQTAQSSTRKRLFDDDGNTDEDVEKQEIKQPEKKQEFKYDPKAASLLNLDYNIGTANSTPAFDKSVFQVPKQDRIVPATISAPKGAPYNSRQLLLRLINSIKRLRKKLLIYGQQEERRAI